MKPAVELSKRSHHIIHLHYPLVLQNVLPFTIDVVENSSSTEKRTLTPGETTHYSHAIIINDPRFLITVSTCTYIMWAIKYHYIAPPPQLFAPWNCQVQRRLFWMWYQKILVKCIPPVDMRGRGFVFTVLQQSLLVWCMCLSLQLNYGGIDWRGECPVNNKSSKFSLHPVNNTTTLASKYEMLVKETCSLVVHKELKGTWHLSVLSPYWMINKTSFILQYAVLCMRTYGYECHCIFFCRKRILTHLLLIHLTWQLLYTQVKRWSIIKTMKSNHMVLTIWT